MEVSGTQRNQDIVVPKDFVAPIEAWLDPMNNLDYENMEIAGVKIHYTSDVMDSHGEKWINWMRESLEYIENTVPSDAWDVMKTIEVYVNNQFYIHGENKAGAVANWSEEWNLSIGNLPEKAGHVEIFNMGDVMDWASWQPSIMLHEFAHHFQYRHGDKGSEINPVL